MGEAVLPLVLFVGRVLGGQGGWRLSRARDGRIWQVVLGRLPGGVHPVSFFVFSRFGCLVIFICYVFIVGAVTQLFDFVSNAPLLYRDFFSSSCSGPVSPLGFLLLSV